MSNRDAQIEVLQGTLDLMVLQTLSSMGPQHGYAIAARLEQVSGGALQLNMGVLRAAKRTQARSQNGMNALRLKNIDTTAFFQEG